MADKSISIQAQRQSRVDAALICDAPNEVLGRLRHAESAAREAEDVVRVCEDAGRADEDIERVV